MILSDFDIKKLLEKWDLIIESNYNVEEQIWPASIDFRLWNTIKYYDRTQLSIVDLKKNIPVEAIRTFFVQDWESFIIHPWQFILWVTKEKILIPDYLVARCEWRSSLWRLGLMIHSTAWFIDPWFQWTITLEIKNISEIPIKLYPWMKVGQFAFEVLKTKAEIPYWQRKSSKYMNQDQVQTSIFSIETDF